MCLLVVWDFRNKTLLSFPLQIRRVWRASRVLGLDARLLRGQVHVGDRGHQGDQTVRGSAIDRAPDQGHPLLHAARGQASLRVVVPALLDGHTELGQALHHGGVGERETALSAPRGEGMPGGQPAWRCCPGSGRAHGHPNPRRCPSAGGTILSPRPPAQEGPLNLNVGSGGTRTLLGQTQ